MNEKEPRSKFQCAARGCDGCNVCETPEQQLLRNDFYAKFTTSSKQHIADWFIARIKERDERLKEAVRGLTPFGIGIPQDPLVSREAIINLFDNHA